MKFKLISQMVLYRISEATFFFFYGLLKLLPSSVYRKVAYPFLWLFVCLVIPKKRIIKNLTAAFGKSYATPTKKGLARGVQVHFIQNLLDCFMQISDGNHARQVIRIHGVEHLEAARRKGNGVIALGAHIGNFVMVGTRLGLEGHNFHILFRIPPDRRIKTCITKYLSHYHQSVIPSLPQRSAVKKILETLRRNEIVYILSDNLKKGNIDALLFGQRVPSPRGPVSLALRSGAPVVPMYLIRSYHGHMQLVIEPEIVMKRYGNLSMDIAENTRVIILHLEALIRRYPDQWNWLTVKMNKYQGDFARRFSADDSSVLKEPTRKEKDGASEKDQIPELMLGKYWQGQNQKM